MTRAAEAVEARAVELLKCAAAYVFLADVEADELENTYVIFVGDNGPPMATPVPYDSNKVKGSLNNGAIHVPFVISGPGITSSTSDAMAHFVDMFPTVLDLAGIEDAAASADVDGISLAPLLTGGTVQRDYILAEAFGGMVQSRIAVQNGTHKLIYTCATGQSSFYEVSDEFESSAVQSNSALTEAILDLNEAGFLGTDYQTVLTNLCNSY